MDRRLFHTLVLATVLCASSVLAQTAPSPTADAAPRDQVVLETSAGAIVIALDPAAPVTSANFLRYVEEKRLDGVDFYRAMKITPTMGLIQGGTQNAPDRILPPIAHEPTSETGLSHVDGAVSMARFDPGSATGDFFIIVGDVRSLDAGRGAPGDPGFAVFGRVVQGMDIVRGIMTSPTSPTEGEGSMRGQMLEPRIRIVSARRVTADPD
ncbi:peptidylprolyl isomerase [Brevundimonas sp. VNH65]|uniref:peptidylprolyl isomerase n=1 Tax=Brevundimonas sp. VNH65 TaxID=3400917 RepID=UPI003C0C23F3